jgi:DNA-binding transcriptional LysR family regulator
VIDRDSIRDEDRGHEGDRGATKAIAGRRRRTYSPEFKREIVLACRKPGASGAGVALSQGINANVVHRWLREERGHSGPLPSSGLIQRPLADVPWHLFAAPGYLAERGRPSTPGDLTEHSALFMFRANVNPAWTLVEEGSGKRETAVSQLRPRMIAACITTLKAAACAGLGIVALPAYICRDELRAGALSRVLPGWLSESSTITALLPNRRGMPPAVRAFLDHLALEFPKAVSIT